MYNLNQFISFLLIILPISLITGPAIPDISVVISIFFLFFYLVYNKNITDLFTFGWFRLFIIFWVYLLVSSLFAYSTYHSIGESIIFLRFLLIPILIYFFLFDNESKSKLVFIVIFISIIFVIVDSLFQFFNYSSENGFQNDLLGYYPDFAPFNRLTGPFKDLVPGAYVSKFAFLGVVFFHIFIKQLKFRYYLIIFYLGICGYLTFISGERMAFATFSLGILIYVIFNKKFKRFSLSAAVIIMLLLIGFTIKIHPSYNDYVIKESSPIELGLIVEKKFKCNSKTDNICTKEVNFQPSFISVIKNFKKSAYGEIYSLALNMYKDNKLFGIGLNNFKKLCVENIYYSNQLKNISCVTHPHNYYLQWLIETGPIGLFIFIAIIFSIISYVIKKSQNHELKLISIIVFIILFWPIMSTGSLTKNWLGVSTFYILGIVIFLHRIKIRS